MDWKYEINIALSILLLSRYKDVPGAVNVYSNQIAKKILKCYANVNELDFDEVMSIVELFRKANTIANIPKTGLKYFFFLNVLLKRSTHEKYNIKTK